MKEEWLMSGAAVPVDVETTAALVAEIKRLVDVVGGLILKQGPDYERGFIDGMMYQTQTSVYRAVDAMSKRTWVSLTDEEVGDLSDFAYANDEEFVRNVEKYLKEKNNG